MLFPFSKNSHPPHRVVVTGAGIVTALGIGWTPNAAGFRSGTRAFRPVTLFDVSKQRAGEAAEVDLPDLPETHLAGRKLTRQDRAARQLIIAAREAWEQAGWTAQEDLPLVLGTTSGGMTLGEAYLRQARENPESMRGQPTRLTHYQAQSQALAVMEALGFTGPLTLIANACASGGNAIGDAFDLIRNGRFSRALCGGYDGLCQLVYAGFDSLQALSTGTCRPFDRDRDGLGLGEGAAVLALESLKAAKQRGAEILGEIVGYGAATDGHHLTQPHPDGDAALQSMMAACALAGISPAEVDYINAHGTGTPLNDQAEAAAINRWAGRQANRLRVSSTKGSIGHCLGAAGAVEAVACLMALRGQWLPPSPMTAVVDPACQFEYLTASCDAPVNLVLSNSFGFGGANATLIFRRWS